MVAQMVSCAHSSHQLLKSFQLVTDHHQHSLRWFKSVDWEEVYQRQLKPPIVPKVSSDGDTRNFDNYPEEEWRNVEPITERQLAMFSDF